LTRDGHPSPPPPWPYVIATTLRLWVQRHVLPARSNGEAGRRHYGAVAAAVAIVVVAASVAAFALATRSDADAHAGRPAGRGPASAQNSKALAAAAAARQQAAIWVAAQVSHGVIVGCDPLMCAALQQHGFPPADLATLGAGASDPLGSGLVISTLAVRSQLGAGLAKVYAPVVVASFGTGPSIVQVRVVVPGGAAASGPAERADLAARQFAGRELAGDSNILAPAAARAELTSGQVDSRLLITLGALVHKFRIQIQGFGDAGPGAGSNGPLRQLSVSTSSATYLHKLVAFLEAQRPPLLAMVTQHRLGRTITVQIQFTAPSPTGLLPAGTTP
jgi:hypothetical protein